MNGNLRGSRAAGALSVLALLLYWGSLGNPLVFDDGQLAGARFQRFDPASVLRFDLRWISTATFGWVREAFGNEVLWQRFANVLLHAMVASVLFGFLRQVAFIHFTRRNIVKPFFSQCFYFVHRYISCYHHYSINRTVMFKEKIFYIRQLCIFNMRQFFTNRHPAVRMLFISQFPHFVPGIAIGFGKVVLFKFFTHHFTLCLQTFFVKSQ